LAKCFHIYSRVQCHHFPFNLTPEDQIKTVSASNCSSHLQRRQRRLRGFTQTRIHRPLNETTRELWEPPRFVLKWADTAGCWGALKEKHKEGVFCKAILVTSITKGRHIDAKGHSNHGV